jgi:acyl carrier protein
MDDELTKRVVAVVAATQRIPAETVTPESTFDELGVDSLDGVNLLFAVEEEFNINIPDEDARQIRGVPDMVAGIRKLLDGAGGSPAQPRR